VPEAAIANTANGVPEAPIALLTLITPEPDESDKLIPLPVIAPASVKSAFPLAVEIMVLEPNVIPVPASPI
jgi:hypothetical protein